MGASIGVQQQQLLQPHDATSITAVLPCALLGRILGTCGLWGDSTAGWSVCREWRDVMVQDPGAVAAALLSRKAGRLAPTLYMATRHGHVGVVLALLSSAGAQVDMACTDHGSSSLHVAACLGHVGLVRALLAAGARVDCTTVDRGASPLYLAAREGHLEVVCALLAAGARVDLATTARGASPLLMAAHNGHLEVVRVLLAAGAQVGT